MTRVYVTPRVQFCVTQKNYISIPDRKQCQGIRTDNKKAWKPGF